MVQKLECFEEIKEREKKLEDWEEKVLHGQYLRQTKEVRSDQCWTWLQNGDVKRDTESIIVVGQNKSIRANLVKTKIDKNQGYSLCRVCRKVDESIDHIVSCCSKLAQKEYKRRQKYLGKIVHWKLPGDKWYENELERALGNEDYKILWDFKIQNGHIIETRRSDLVAVDKKERSCKIIDFEVPEDSRIEEKEKDQIGKYQERKGVTEDMERYSKDHTISGMLFRCYTQQFDNRLKQTGSTTKTSQIQQTVFFGSARILRKVLEI